MKPGRDPAWRIGDLAREVGVSPKTIRFYERAGALPPPTRTPNGYRSYGPEDARRLRFVISARRLGFSLDDVKEVLAFRDRGEAPCPFVLHLLGEKAREVEQRLAELRALRQELQELEARARDLPLDSVEMKHCVCHLIEAGGGVR